MPQAAGAMTSESDPTRDHGDARSDSGRWDTVRAFLAVLSAALGVATAILGLLTAQATSQRDAVVEQQSETQQDLAGLRAENDGLAAEVTALEDDNRRLEEENDELRARPSAGEQPPPDPADANAPERFRGQVRLADGNAIDLDGERPGPADPAWSEVTYQADTDTLALHVSSGAPAFALWTEKREPTREECVALLDTHALSESEEDVHRPEPGLGLCIGTFGDDLIAFMRVGERKSNSLMANAVVWAESTT